MSFSTSIATTAIPFTTKAVSSPWVQAPDWYKDKLQKLLSAHLHRLQNATKLTLDEIAQTRLGWSRGNHFSQLTSPKKKHILSPASTLLMAKALELDDEETDQLVIVTMRANSDRGCEMTPEFLSRYEKATLRRVCETAKERGIRLS